MRIPKKIGLALLFAGTASAVGADPREVTTKAAGADVPRATASAEVRDLPARLPQLSLVVYDVHGLLDSDFADLVGETSAIFEEMGVDIGWRRGGLGTVHGAGPLREIPVILLKEPPGKLRAQRDVLGLIPKNQPAAIWVFVENVKRTIAVVTRGPGPADSRLAVAVGRVVAHELVHSLAPELGHTKRGLMRHALDREALVGRVRPSHAECAGAVRAALKLAPSATPQAAASLLPFPPRY